MLRPQVAVRSDLDKLNYITMDLLSTTRKCHSKIEANSFAFPTLNILILSNPFHHEIIFQSYSQKNLPTIFPFQLFRSCDLVKRHSRKIHLINPS